ncbi:LptF/LptG family permease [Prochlorococcus marinus]|uniref:LptF/LptG family permease n=1 Tax=Prochlorococcus marinus TaxID=1219 RepID=UPI0022B593A5|nr:LptF/LptG family permease [Prochlorococcus marinus]
MKNKIINLLLKISNFFRIRINHIPLLDRWILSQLIPPLVFSISAFTVVSVSVGVMFDLVRKIVELDLPLNTALNILVLRLPSFIVLSFPMATLLASLLTYSKLSSNSELKALRAIGISVYRIILPSLLLALVMTGLTFIFNNNIVPYSNSKAEFVLRSSLGKSISIEEGEDIIYSRKGNITDLENNKVSYSLTHIFYAKDYTDGFMNQVKVLDLSKYGYTQILTAEKAFWDPSIKKWELLNGKLVVFSEKGDSTITKFNSYLYPFNTGPIKIASIPKDANDMTLAEAKKALQIYKDTSNIKEVRRLKVRIQEKFTLPMSCLVFSLIGSSLASIPNSRTNRSQGFGISIILILFYYILSFTFSSLGVKGSISYISAAWSPVFISTIIGIILMRRANK